jgi:DNA helicase-2/ATP-dependent DNA helicase PcrA
VDEAQDRSALEIKVLLEAVHAPDDDPGKRSVTIAGDTAQRLVFDNNFSGWAELLAQTGQLAIVRPLKLSYRSTAEVMLLAREILGPELAPEDPLAARPGEPVELHEFGDLGEAVAFLSDALRNLMAREPTASCAVISRHPEQADAYFEGLRRAEVPALRRVRRDEFNFQPGIDITDIAQVKGLEFDYVVMVDVNAASYPNQHWARHMLHIGVTRAAHQLWMVAIGEPSPLIPAALRDGGRMGVV